MPGKVMRTAAGSPLLGLLLSRLSGARLVHQIVVATSDLPRDDVIARYVTRMGFTIHRGNELDVLDRFHSAAVGAGADAIVRITADCPLVDSHLVDAVIEKREAMNAPYASNALQPTFPMGLDVEVMTFAALDRAWREAVSDEDREHVTPFIIRAFANPDVEVRSDVDLSLARWTVDEPEDLIVIGNVFEHFHPRLDFRWEEIAALMSRHPHLFAANRHIDADPRRS